MDGHNGNDRKAVTSQYHDAGSVTFQYPWVRRTYGQMEDHDGNDRKAVTSQ